MINVLALAPWSSGVVSVCGVMGREIESRHRIVWKFLKMINTLGDFWGETLALLLKPNNVIFVH
jgi:hypothetical protein